MAKRLSLSEMAKNWVEDSRPRPSPVIAAMSRWKSYVAEEGLFKIVENALMRVDWEEAQDSSGGRCHLNLPPFKKASTLQHVPASLAHRRLRMYGTGQFGSPPRCRKLFRVLEDYVDLGLGFERSGSLGPVLNAERLRLWAAWAASFDRTREDPYDSFDPGADAWEGHTQLAELLLRRGYSPDRTGSTDLLPSQRIRIDLSRGQVIACVARYAFARALKNTSPDVAATEVLKWAVSNWTITTAHEQTILRQLSSIWNDVLEPTGLTKSDLRLLRSIFPSSDPASARRRQAALRLLARLKAQAVSWNTEVVAVPTTWFRRSKDAADPRSIVGVSSGYQRDLLSPLGEAGVLDLVQNASFRKADRQCAHYRLSRLDLDGDPLPLADAEALLLRD